MTQFGTFIMDSFEFYLESESRWGTEAIEGLVPGILLGPYREFKKGR